MAAGRRLAFIDAGNESAERLVDDVVGVASDDGNRRVGGRKYLRRVPQSDELPLATASVQLRRPLLSTGALGTGKYSLTYLLAWELGLGPILRWPITLRTTLTNGFYLYDASARGTGARSCLPTLGSELQPASQSGRGAGEDRRG
jgi:MoxR-like ATPase